MMSIYLYFSNVSVCLVLMTMFLSYIDVNLFFVLGCQYVCLLLVTVDVVH